ncbi:MAG: hypothetical protein QOF12_2605 [Solirubrobacteraceae bacterium]|nr:hypothetical protein [Solirubrobacteraceae bacterium]
MTDAPAEPGTPPAPAPTTCPRCGAEIAADQAWCTECGLAVRTRLAPPPGWRTPLLAAGAIGLAAIVALIVAFVVLTGDNAPVPVTTSTAAVPAAPAATAPPATTPPATTPATPPTTTAIPPATAPTTTTPPTGTTTAPTGAE